MAKKQQTTTTQEQPTKSAAVRDILATGLTAPKEIADAVKAKYGIEVSALYVSSIKSKEGKGDTTKTPIQRRKAVARQTHEAVNGRASIVAFVRVAKMLGKSEAIDLINELL